MGTPTDEDLEWIPAKATRDYVKKISFRPRQDFKQVFAGASSEVIDLLERVFQVGACFCSKTTGHRNCCSLHDKVIGTHICVFCQFNPHKRPTAAQLLEHRYFSVSGYRDPQSEVGPSLYHLTS